MSAMQLGNRGSRTLLMSIIVAGVLLATLAAAVVMTTSRGTVYEPTPALQSLEAGHANTAERPPLIPVMTASTALASGKLTLFYFTPVEVCGVRFCVEGVVLRQQVARMYGAEIVVVEVPVHARPYAAGAVAQQIDARWDLPDSVPYVDWLPAPAETEFGWGLQEPAAVLVAADGTAVMQSGMFVDGEALRRYLP